MYFSGFLTAIETYDQTFNLGVREAGMFKVRFVGWISSNDTICDFVQSQSMDLEINVEGTNSIEIINQSFEAKIFPNPNHINEVNIFSEKELDTILIFDGLGRLITRHFQNPNQVAKVKIDHLPEGVYFVKGLLNSEVVFVEKMIRN